MQTNIYLHFDDNTKEVFDFYKSVFGGEFAALQHFKDVPAEAAEGSGFGESESEKVMHISLPLGNGQMLMGSDTPESAGTTKLGNNISISLHPDTEEEARRIFGALSEDGTVKMPFEKAFWGALFGMCTDTFGVSWMVNFDLSQQ